MRWWVIAAASALWGLSCFPDDSSSSLRPGAAFGPTPSIAGSGPLPGSGTCDPLFCPATAAGPACCVTASGPCGYPTATGCESAPPTTGGSGGAPPVCAERPSTASEACPHEARCRAACASAGAVCADAAGFDDHCLARCCETTREATPGCADCIASGLRARLLCDGTCRCSVSFLADTSDSCGDVCEERTLGACSSHASCGMGPVSCRRICGLDLCIDPRAPTCACDGPSDCPAGSYCTCGCDGPGFCAPVTVRERLCAEPLGRCFNCSEGGRDRDGGLDASVADDAASPVTDAAAPESGPGASMPSDASDAAANDSATALDGSDARG